MTDERFSPKRLLNLRRLTRAVAEALREPLSGYVAALAPLLKPKAALGAYAEGGTRDPVPTYERTMKELVSLYEQIATDQPFNLSREIKLPLELLSAGIDVSPLEYSHVVHTPAGARTIKVSSPLKWVLSYNGLEPGRLAAVNYTPRRLKEQLTTGSRSNDELRKFVLHHVALHLTIARQRGVAGVFQDLRFPLETVRVADFGSLPLSCAASTITTVRPPDDVLIEHTEISGTDTFEEIIDADEMPRLPDPLDDRLVEVAREAGVALSQ